MNRIFTDWLISLKHYVLMSLFNSSPSQLPYNPSTIAITLFIYILAGDALLGTTNSLASIISLVLVETIIFFVICFIVFKLNNNLARLTQTLSALIGVSLVITLASLVSIQLIPDSIDDQINPQAITIKLVLLFWNLAAISLIFKRAFEVRTLVAGFIAFNYFVFYELIIQYLLL